MARVARDQRDPVARDQRAPRSVVQLDQLHDFLRRVRETGGPERWPRPLLVVLRSAIGHRKAKDELHAAGVASVYASALTSSWKEGHLVLVLSLAHEDPLVRTLDHPTVAMWTRAVDTLMRSRALRRVCPRDAFSDIVRQYRECMDVDPLEAAEVVGRYVPRVSSEIAMTIYVVVCTLYRMSQEKDPLSAERLRTFRDLWRREVDVRTVLRPWVYRVFAAGHLARRDLVVDVLFGDGGYPLPNAAWVSTYSMGLAVITAGTETGSSPSTPGRVLEVPLVTSVRDLPGAIRTPPDTRVVFFPKRPPLSGASRGFWQAMKAMECAAKRFREMAVSLLVIGHSDALPRPDLLRCIVCPSRGTEAPPLATHSFRGSVLPLLCTRCAAAERERGGDSDPEPVALDLFTNISSQRCGEEGLSDSLLRDVVLIQKTMMIDLDPRPSAISRVFGSTDGYLGVMTNVMPFLQRTHELERMTDRGAFAFAAEDAALGARGYVLQIPEGVTAA